MRAIASAPAGSLDPAPALIAADWGTTSCRFALISADGTVLDRVTGRGILPVLADAEETDAGQAAHEAGADPRSGAHGPAPSDGRTRGARRSSPSAQERAALFEAELRRQIGPWLTADPGIPVLMCGMIGSNTGWVDAGYREVPCEVVVDPSDLAPAPLEGHAAWIVPGLIIRGHAPDIMRGEETQALGALLEADDAAEHLVIAPGTHSKWARIRSGRVTGFRSYLTGEMFTALREHTIIGRGIPDAAPAGAAAEQEAFLAGLERASLERAGADTAHPSLLHTVFSARTRVVAGDLEPSAVPAYLSGLLIGDEIADGLAAAELDPGTTVTVIGSSDLAERYRSALAHAGITARVAGPDATLRGLIAIAEAAGWLRAAPGHEDTDDEETV